MAKNRNPESSLVATTTLGRETVFSGTLRFTDSLRIRGSFEGEIDATGRLYIDPEATVTASIIRASSVVIGGTVKGDIEAPEKIEMLSTAKVYGNVKTTRLRIADGVVFEGTCHMIREPAVWSPFTDRDSATA